MPFIVSDPAEVVVNVPVPLKVKSVILLALLMLSVFKPGILIVTLSNEPGMPLGVQLAAVPQSDEEEPFHV